jgi:hypothetical protein
MSEIMAQPEANIPETPVETAEQTITQEVKQEEPRKLKVKVLHEERELTESEAIPYIQKGMDYDRVKSQYESAAEEKKFVEKLAKKYGMPIDQFKREMEASADAASRAELINQGIPEEIAKEIVENREFRKELKEKETLVQTENRKQREAADFVKEFPGVNAESIPKSVWADVDAGIPLVHAYARYDRGNLVSQLAEFNKQKVVEAKNAEAATASPGSTSGASVPTTASYTQEQVLNMTQREIADNYDKIMKSTKLWK